MGEFLKAIPAAAANPLALVAYAISAILFVYGGAKLVQTRAILKQILAVPVEQRKAVIQLAADTVLPDTVSAEHWIKVNRIRASVLVIIAILISLTVLGALALEQPRQPRPTDTRLQRNAYELGFQMESFFMFAGMLAQRKDDVTAKGQMKEIIRTIQPYTEDFGVGNAAPVLETPEDAHNYLASFAERDDLSDQLRIKHGATISQWYNLGLLASGYSYQFDDPNPEARKAMQTVRIRLLDLSKKLDIPAPTMDAFFLDPKQSVWKLSEGLK
jgi:hypothetical protein